MYVPCCLGVWSDEAVSFLQSDTYLLLPARKVDTAQLMKEWMNVVFLSVRVNNAR